MMKNKIFLKSIMTILVIVLNLSFVACDKDIIQELELELEQEEGNSLTLHVKEAGTLPSLISQKNKHIIKELTLTGDLNGTDLLFIREMTSNVLNNKSIGDLELLNLEGANFVRGGSAYFEGKIITKDNEIPFEAFAYTNLVRVILPNSITTIGMRAFFRCEKLSNVIIANNVTSIKEEAFRTCISLTSVVIPNSVTEIGEMTFVECKNLTSINIPDGISSIRYYTFSNCEKLKSIIIPDKTDWIGEGAFSGCRALTSIDIPDRIGIIEENVFSGCTGLISIIIPDGITTISTRAFQFCSNLKRVTLGRKVSLIEHYSFSNCVLEEVYSKNRTPPKTDPNGFSTGWTIKKLYVPKGSKESYKKAKYSGWFVDKEEDNIIEVDDNFQLAQ